MKAVIQKARGAKEMVDNEKISGTQLCVFIVLAVLGVGAFSLPRQVAEAAGNDGWVTVLLGGAATFFDYFLISRLARKFPGDTLVEISMKITGKYVSYILLLIFWLYMLLVVSMTIRIFGEVVKMSILKRTPIEVILISLLVLVLALVRGGVEPIVRFDQVVFPIIVVTIVFIIIFALPRTDPTNILPFFRTSPDRIIKGTYQTMYSYGGFELVLLILPFIREPRKILRPGFISFLIIAGIYLSVVILSLFKFGALDVTKLIWPTLSLIRSIEIPGSFIERSEAIVMATWILLAFTAICPVTYGLALLPSRVSKQKEFKHFCSIVLPIIYILALIPDNISDAYAFLGAISTYMETPAIFLIPILLLIVSSIRKVGNSAHG